MEKSRSANSSLLSEPLELWLSNAHCEDMAREAGSKAPLETGGVLMGYWADSVCVITAVIGPGPNAQHKRYSFVPDPIFQQGEIERQFIESEGVCTYLGDWHSHPDASAYMSRRDRSTLSKIAKFERASQQKPIMLILAGNQNWLPKAWAWNRRSWWFQNSSSELPIQRFVPGNKTF